MSEDVGSGGHTDKSGADPVAEARSRILAAALPHVPFDGWSDACLKVAAQDAGVDAHVAKLAFPRGGVDMAIAHHRAGDAEMAARLKEMDFDGLRVRDRIIFAVRTRIEIAARHRDAVRRAAALFALPTHAATGARLIWETADHIWTVLGDPSEDLNWYSKRAILSGVYSATLLYWLGDESPGNSDTWAFLDRRIDGVMRFEKFKAKVKENPLGRMMMRGPDWLASRIRKPGGPVDTGTRVDLPG